MSTHLLYSVEPVGKSKRIAIIRSIAAQKDKPLAWHHKYHPWDLFWVRAFTTAYLLACASTALAGTGILQSQYVKGRYRHCIYSDGYHLTIDALAICPATSPEPEHDRC